jgi:hypothetical protein
MCPLLAPVFQGFFFLLRPLTVLMKQTRQTVLAVNQSILLRCLWVTRSIMLECCYAVSFMLTVLNKSFKLGVVAP